MTGKERILTALNVEQPDRVPLYIHGMNEAPIIGIGKHLTEGLPQIDDFYAMNDAEKMKLVDARHLCAQLATGGHGKPDDQIL